LKVQETLLFVSGRVARQRVATVSAFLTVGLWGMVWGMSNIHRLRTTDRIFFGSR